MKLLLSSPHMGGNEQKYIKEAFETNWLAPLGPNVDAFEDAVAKYNEIPYSVALSSGTAAIHMALKCVRIEPGDTVFCSTLTFAASCNPAVYEGAELVFIDSEPDTWNMSPRALRKALLDAAKMNKLPKAVIVVHLYGQCADMAQILEICEYFGVPVIEDAAEALGATYRGSYAGTFGDYGIYSFNGNKIITTTGGGMIVSNNGDMMDKVRFWSAQSKDDAPYYQHSEIGYNYRMSNVCAGIGRGQMEVLDERIEKKTEIFKRYEDCFKDLPEIEMMPIKNYGVPNYWLSCATLTDECMMTPQELIDTLAKHGIESRRIWKPMHLQPVFKDCKFYSHFNHETESVAEDIFNRGICLPSDTKMTKLEQHIVCEIIRDIIESEEK